MKHMLLTVLAFVGCVAYAHPPLPEAADRIRLGETFRLADKVQDQIWDGWSAVPFVVLLVTPEHEYLLRHPQPPADFVNLGMDASVGAEIFARPTSGRYAPHFLATFPAVAGVNTVVIGQPEHTNKSSTRWVLTALHEHFHQLQYTRPGYYQSVADLDLAGGDDTGQWQLDYPFPYETEPVAASIMAWRDALMTALSTPKPHLSTSVDAYLESRGVLEDSLDENDYRYLSFQLWQEGVARYTEHAVAEWAARHHRPSPAFEGLGDYMSYGDAVQELEALLTSELEALNLGDWRRTVFYPLGAAEAKLLDASRPGWKKRYFTEPFFLERYFGKSRKP